MATINVDEKKEVPDSIIIKSKEDLKAKLERGLSNPTLKTLQKIADALDMELSIKFIPKKTI